MLVDIVSALIRALSFIALLQAAGVAIFVAVFGAGMKRASASVRRVGFVSAIAGIVLVFAHYSLEAARMAGALSGVLDLSLQQVVLDSSMSTAWGLRTAGLVLIAMGITRREAGWAFTTLSGAALAIAAFLFVGHTANDSEREWLAVLLTLHLAVIAFWFGALAPLYVVSRTETAVTAAQVVYRFSRIAVWWVPAIFLAGTLMSVLLIDRWAVFTEVYGAILLAKAAAFGVLMVFAALNKWRFGPALATSAHAIPAFQRALAAEYLLICAVLVATAVMTTFFSPEH